jgi:hypothetical protein
MGNSRYQKTTENISVWARCGAVQPLILAGRQTWEEHGLMQKKKQKNCDPITKNKLGIAVHICNLSYSRGGDRKLTVQGKSWQKSTGPYLKNKVKQKGLEA